METYQVAIIDAEYNIVVNVAVVGGAWLPPDGTFAVDMTNYNPCPGIGWIYDPATGQFTDPNSPQEEV
jgi:hypothetical protein